jgi:hypothetical protein
MSTYTIIKLNTGQDIICSLTKEHSSSYLLEVENPMSIYHSVAGDGATIILLKRFNPLALSTKITIERAHIIATYAPQKEFANYYDAILAFHEKVLDEMAVKDLTIATSFIDAAIMNDKFEEAFKGIKEKEKKYDTLTKTSSKKVH